MRRALKRERAWPMEMIKRANAASGFDVWPRGRVIGLTRAWLRRCPCLATERKGSIPSAEAWLLIAHVRILIRRLARFHAGLAVL